MIKDFGFVVIALGLASVAIAQTDDRHVADDRHVGFIEEVISIGSRAPDRVAIYSSVPVDVVSVEDLRDTGQTEVGRMIQALVPSFNFSSSSISDGTDALRPATLRGLGPDQTLVLVNGKRRHSSALIHVNTSVGRGTAGTDLNAIPQIALKRVEVLRDGASAQYGSDAIAGAINLVLEDSQEASRFGIHYGGYTEGDGENLVLSVFNAGTIWGDGKWSVAIEYRDRAATNRAGLSGECQYTIGGCGEPATSIDPREASFNRQNFRIGDADSSQLSGVVNVAIPITNNVEFYFFSTFSDRNNESAGFYRRANQVDRNPGLLKDGVTEVNAGNAYLADGFLPLIQTSVNDYSFDFGFSGGSVDSWQWDASLGWGLNSFAFNIADSLNASHVANLAAITDPSPREAYAGKLLLRLFNAEFNANKLLAWGHAAFGVVVRQDRYELRHGEEFSYRDYDTGAAGVFTGAASLTSNDNFADAVGGIQVFPGFRPDNAVDEKRASYAAYADVEWNASKQWLLGGAARVENYDDFGTTFNVKGTVLFALNEMFSLRGALSTGFRAPSLPQQYFNNVSTQFDSSGVAVERGTFRNDSDAAKALGIPALQEEKSLNFSGGFVFRPVSEWFVSVDYYRIDIKDRVVLSGSIKASNMALPATTRNALTAAGASQAQVFSNAADTRTEGVDLVTEYSASVGAGDLRVSFGMNWTDTNITAVQPPQSLSSVVGVQDLIFTSQDRSILTEWQPKWHGNFTTSYSIGPVVFSGSARLYGPYTVEDGGRQTFGSKTLIDISFSYDLTNDLILTVGGNNITDQTPDVNTIGQSRAGTIVDGSGNTIVDSPGVFTYSRRSAPFGFNGAYSYVGLVWNF